MLDNNILISKLQKEVDACSKGYLLKVALTNFYEINLLGYNIEQVTSNFFNIIKTICELKNYNNFQNNSGDVIYIVLNGEEKNIADLAHKINHDLKFNEFNNIFLSSKISCVSFSSKEDVRELIAKLEYAQKNSSVNSYYFCYEDEPVDLDELRQNNLKLNILTKALKSQEVKFVYQPIIDSVTKDIIYHECLLRIDNDQGRDLSIGPLIKLAEKKGLSDIIDRMVVEMAIKELASNSDIKLSVNISNIALLNSNLLVKIEQLLAEFKVADRLIFEITETSFNNDFAKSKKFIDKVKSFGSQFALDDFGSGFTSFKQLLLLPIDIIKIDGSYIKDILTNNNHKIFVEGLVNLAKEMGVKTVAEYVENNNIADYLIEIRVDAMQGNYFLPASVKIM